MRSTSRLLFSPSTALNKHAPAYVSSKTHTVPAAKVPGRQFKRGQEGLFGGARVLSGNNVPHSMHKTRRKWYPNAQTKSLFSEILGASVKIKLTSRVLRSIDKMGGFDQYIQNTSAQELGDEGIRWRIILEQHVESGRKPLFSAKADASTSSALSAPTGNPTFYSPSTSSNSAEEQPAAMEEEEEASLSNLPESELTSEPALSSNSPSSSSGLLFERNFRKRDPNSPPRIPVFTKSLQKSFVRQNVTRSIIAARKMGEPRSAPSPVKISV